MRQEDGIAALSDDPVLTIPEQVVLVLQGGGALGSYQAGVFKGMVERSIPVTCVAGISIGAVNAALIAGNPPEARLDALKQFWERVTSGMPNMMLPDEGPARQAVHIGAAGTVMAFGIPDFFQPRPVPPFFSPRGSMEAISWYDSGPLRATLDELVDWDRVNDGPVRLAVGAVDVETGNFAYFDTAGDDPVRIDARHVMASGALPPGLPPVEIDGRHYWDGGIVSNTPLAHIFETQADQSALIFQVDLFSARGPIPKTMMDVWSREKDIRFSSRTRLVTDQYMRERKDHEAIRRLLDKLPETMKSDPDVRHLQAVTADYPVNVVHLIYRQQSWQTGAKDFEFSRSSIRHHWNEGRDALRRSMKNGDILARNIADGKTATFDLDK